MIVLGNLLVYGVSYFFRIWRVFYYLKFNRLFYIIIGVYNNFIEKKKVVIIIFVLKL